MLKNFVYLNQRIPLINIPQMLADDLNEMSSRFSSKTGKILQNVLFVVTGTLRVNS